MSVWITGDSSQLQQLMHMRCEDAEIGKGGLPLVTFRVRYSRTLCQCVGSHAGIDRPLLPTSARLPEILLPREVDEPSNDVPMLQYSRNANIGFFKNPTVLCAESAK